MTPKFMQLLEQCVLNGVILGHKRAYKHNDAPSESDINMSIVQEVMTEIHEWFDCDETKGLTASRKPWVGLTDEDCIEAQKNSWNEYKNGKELKFDGYKLCKNIEQILKEKNT
jgi:hypothetical protein